jgi:hypothetical protein
LNNYKIFKQNFQFIAILINLNFVKNFSKKKKSHLSRVQKKSGIHKTCLSNDTLERISVGE